MRIFFPAIFLCDASEGKARKFIISHSKISPHDDDDVVFNNVVYGFSVGFLLSRFCVFCFIEIKRKSNTKQSTQSERQLHGGVWRGFEKKINIIHHSFVDTQGE
jgi:hypothetical protein